MVVWIGQGIKFDRLSNLGRTLAARVLLLVAAWAVGLLVRLPAEREARARRALLADALRDCIDLGG